MNLITTANLSLAFLTCFWLYVARTETNRFRMWLAYIIAVGCGLLILL